MKTRLLFLLLFGVSARGLCQNLPAEKADFEGLRIQLKAIHNHDQTLRRKLDVAQMVAVLTPPGAALWLEINKADSLNLLQVRAILDKWGWAQMK